MYRILPLRDSGQPSRINMTEENTSPGQTTFLDLPRELRGEIYKYFFKDEVVHEEIDLHQVNKYLPRPHILHAFRQVRTETTDLYQDAVKRFWLSNRNWFYLNIDDYSDETKLNEHLLNGLTVIPFTPHIHFLEFRINSPPRRIVTPIAVFEDGRFHWRFRDVGEYCLQHCIERRVAHILGKFFHACTKSHDLEREDGELDTQLDINAVIKIASRVAARAKPGYIQRRVLESRSGMVRLDVDPSVCAHE
jgi:hypothetical protein